jgi:hypothetical protein
MVTLGWDGWPTSDRTTTTGSPIFATVSSSLRWAIFAAVKIGKTYSAISFSIFSRSTRFACV